jgi:hypothetical protein
MNKSDNDSNNYYNEYDNDANDDVVGQEANERVSLLAQDVDEQHAKQEQEAKIKIQ